MSAPEIVFYSPSTALINLCQAQVRLLQQCLQLDRCEVYVTENPDIGQESGAIANDHTSDHTFVPLVIYPQTNKAFVSRAGLTSLPQAGNVLKSLGSSSGLLSFGDKEAIALPPTKSFASSSVQSEALLLSIDQPLVLPLIYQEEIMGVLVTGRRTPAWQSQELQQLESAAQALAIACQLDRGQSWYAAQLKQQQVRHHWERDRFDDLLHQLRNPLTALKTFSKLLFKRLGKEEKVQTIVQGIMREGEHLQSLLQSFEIQIGEIVESERAEVWETRAWREELEETPSSLLLPSQALVLTALEIKPILSQVLFAETAIATEAQINLESDLPDLPPILGEANALREVFHNLINNALKYTPHQGLVRVRSGLVHPQQSQLWQGIEVADTGYGIPTADQQHIFERHYRGVQAQGDIPGTGLGLAIVQELVEMMEGNLELISPNYLSLDQSYPGTTFRLWLKVAK